MMLEVECDCHRGNRRTLFNPIPLLAKAVARTDVLFEDLGDKVASTSLSTHRLVQPAAADMWSWATLLEHTACFCVCKASFLQVFNVEEVRISIHFRCCGRP
jgi:hypothetical protein